MVHQVKTAIHQVCKLLEEIVGNFTLEIRTNINSKKYIMKKKILITGILASGILAFASVKMANKTEITTRNVPKTQIEIPVSKVASAENTIQVAILLDTSSSMDGLIDQAKSRLWNIVNTLTTLKYKGKAPKIEIALYEYGNDGISDKNWIRKITPLTQDLDLISEKLFALKTNGGTEYCGAVIKDAASQLEWNNSENSMKLVYIAGNEAFNQEGINYKEAIAEAKKKGIFINTIFCGNREEGIRTFWQDGATYGNGKYFNIDSDQKVIFVPTPYDDRISECNVKLNATYLGYGSKGYEKKSAQVAQDRNAASMSEANAVERTVAKSKATAYRNESWDLVDKAEKDKGFLGKIKNEDLPEELKGKSTSEITKIVAQKSEDRSNLQKEIEVLAKKRQDYIDAELKKRGDSKTDDLGKAIEKSIQEIGLKKGYTMK